VTKLTSQCEQYLGNTVVDHNNVVELAIETLAKLVFRYT